MEDRFAQEAHQAPSPRQRRPKTGAAQEACEALPRQRQRKPKPPAAEDLHHARSERDGAASIRDRDLRAQRRAAR